MMGKKIERTESATHLRNHLWGISTTRRMHRMPLTPIYPLIIISTSEGISYRVHTATTGSFEPCMAWDGATTLRVKPANIMSESLSVLRLFLTVFAI